MTLEEGSPPNHRAGAPPRHQPVHQRATKQRHNMISPIQPFTDVYGSYPTNQLFVPIAYHWTIDGSCMVIDSGPYLTRERTRNHASTLPNTTTQNSTVSFEGFMFISRCLVCGYPAAQRLGRCANRPMTPPPPTAAGATSRGRGNISCSSLVLASCNAELSSSREGGLSPPSESLSLITGIRRHDPFGGSVFIKPLP